MNQTADKALEQQEIDQLCSDVLMRLKLLQAISKSKDKLAVIQNLRSQNKNLDSMTDEEFIDVVMKDSVATFQMLAMAYIQEGQNLIKELKNQDRQPKKSSIIY
jgi:hypothetical protein